jgi:hypothetical protein
MAGNRFVVDLGKMDLDDAARTRIERSIQDVVLREINERRLAGRPVLNVGVHFPKEWYGIWINPIDLPGINPPNF